MSLFKRMFLCGAGVRRFHILYAMENWRRETSWNLRPPPTLTLYQAQQNTNYYMTNNSLPLWGMTFMAFNERNIGDNFVWPIGRKIDEVEWIGDCNTKNIGYTTWTIERNILMKKTNCEYSKVQVLIFSKKKQTKKWRWRKTYESMKSTQIGF